MIEKKAERPRISVLGCGWFGLPLAEHLAKSGFAVKGSTTTGEKLGILKSRGIIPYLINIGADTMAIEDSFFDSDILVISIPPNKNGPDLNQYPQKIQHIADAAKKGSVKEVVFISSTGVFCDGNSIVTELTIPNPEQESGKMMLAAELLLGMETEFRTTIIRFAGLIGPLRLLAKHFAGRAEIANGLAPINLIHLDDCIGITKAIIAQQAFGQVFHGVAPDHPTRAAFYTKNCKVNGFEQPAFKSELLQWKQIESIHITNLNYQFQVSDWNAWLDSLTQ